MYKTILAYLGKLKGAKLGVYGTMCYDSSAANHERWFAAFSYVGT